MLLYFCITGTNQGFLAKLKFLDSPQSAKVHQTLLSKFIVFKNIYAKTFLFKILVTGNQFFSVYCPLHVTFNNECM